MSASFTPGPWASVRGYLVSANVDAAENALDRPTNNDGIYVAEAKGPDRDANAILIAASPDLYAALVDMLADFGSVRTYEGGVPASVVAARLAIRNARGAA